MHMMSILYTAADAFSSGNWFTLFKCHYVNSKPAHWPIGLNVRQWSGRPGFNPRSRHTKDFKNGT